MHGNREAGAQAGERVSPRVRSLILDPWPRTLLELTWAFLTVRLFEELGGSSEKGTCNVREKQQSQLLGRGVICLWQLGTQGNGVWDDYFGCVMRC